MEVIVIGITESKKEADKVSNGCNDIHQPMPRPYRSSLGVRITHGQLMVFCQSSGPGISRANPWAGSLVRHPVAVSRRSSQPVAFELRLELHRYP